MVIVRIAASNVHLDKNVANNAPAKIDKIAHHNNRGPAHNNKAHRDHKAIDPASCSARNGMNVHRNRPCRHAQAKANRVDSTVGHNLWAAALHRVVKVHHHQKPRR